MSWLEWAGDLAKNSVIIGVLLYFIKNQISKTDKDIDSLNANLKNLNNRTDSYHTMLAESFHTLNNGVKEAMGEVDKLRRVNLQDYSELRIELMKLKDVIENHGKRISEVTTSKKDLERIYQTFGKVYQILENQKLRIDQIKRNQK